MYQRIIVTGSPYWNNTAIIKAELAKVWNKRNVLVASDDKDGATALCVACWTTWGGRVEIFRPDEEEHGTRAWYQRDLDMVEEGAEHCLAFVLGKSGGTNRVVELADEAGIRPKIIRSF
ncbi:MULTISPECIES: hypothetical protein [unclassified Crossiella]|uniref:hypothetical protein n=1 Tax=unclassified Crossiella TaxID=2620835 RepID=UPI001FFE7B3D|nr:MULTISPECIES: hypothetical protein [unclassified Crossiella]MCK2240008.1 hypothetical protein [Crossiella sp. S99.2]MCK2252716.1 hypothetical protein [Crossiella sp. S99.1]